MKFDLVFEGGGAKGIVFVGAVQEFEAQGHTADRLLGTSAGAITATLLAAGYTSEQMLAALNEQEDGKPVFMGFMGVPGPFTEQEVAASAMMDFLRAIDLPLVPEFVERKLDAALVDLFSRSEKYRHLFSFVERGGWYIADRFRSWLTEKLDTGEVAGKPRRFGSMTLAEFHAATGRELSLVAADTSGQGILVLNHRTAPRCPVVWAARMSMSIPFVWQEVEWSPDWGTYRGRDVSGHMIVDGGVLSNFPIELFVSGEPHVTNLMGEKRTKSVMGLLIDETLEVPNAPAPPKEGSPSTLGRLKTITRIKRLVDTITTAHDKEIIESLSDLVVRMPARGYGTTEFDMNEERRAALVAAGRQSMRKHLGRPAGLESVAPPQEAARVQHEATRLATRFLEMAE
ncbi:MAG TPA: patatin-like phospholipase family protein [Vicinamibacteria bacterium]|nr:patatin-like phospholipase family protein [Vicinamibacteria bacterium]